MSNWPVLRKFDSEHLSRISMPLGGIGTGSVSLGGRGDLRDWEIMNIPSKGFAPKFARGSAPFFAIRTKSGSDIQARALEGPLEDHEYEGSSGSPTPNHGLPRFRNCSFGAAYPFGQVQLSDPDMPVKVELEAFNPLIPGDVARSSYPVAILRYTVHNKTSKALDVSICGTVPNFIGNDRRKFKEGEIGACKNRNRKKKTKHVQGITMDSQGV
ncbi:MAG: hypothetical protein HRT89_06090, partial [Lentisphaeria bacterium]|nr:hypothetical protein [Lentisphaeria bacterium]NQZ67622.1 hypothetical protein [Lentisphaeria bacterium]